MPQDKLSLPGNQDRRAHLIERPGLKAYMQAAKAMSPRVEKKRSRKQEL